MKNALLVFFPLLLVFLLTACGVTSKTSGNSGKFQISNPYSGLTSADIQSLSITQNLGIERNSASSDIEIAGAILVWQTANMVYRNDSTDSYAMRWNKVLPGIYHVRDLIQDRTSVDGKIYGLCWDYAAIFNAIAEYYQVSARVSAYKKYIAIDEDNKPISGADPVTRDPRKGLSSDEYKELQKKLIANNLSYADKEHHKSPLLSSPMENFCHYRAEVEVSTDNWVSYEGTNVTWEYATFSYDAWDAHYDSNLAYK